MTEGKASGRLAWRYPEIMTERVDVEKTDICEAEVRLLAYRDIGGDKTSPKGCDTASHVFSLKISSVKGAGENISCMVRFHTY